METTTNIKIPSNRKERVKWLAQKFGQGSIIVWADKTDREVKNEFTSMYRLYNNMKDFDEEVTPSPCIICGSEVMWITRCGCGEGLAILDKDDPDYEKRIIEINEESNRPAERRTPV
ncbi:hypothetical protein [Paenibacillus terrae]|uniref:Uncharacterized protein n=1 Tax=Paenibacillus terrae TaxID=159743 RepID=A0A0D7WVA7_9BACL|nr:hypothetical protein [Paenibacillus terrae]KJD42653.1 hypothetical protein QD47_26960 [Paenibacillus terrae]